MEVYIGIPDHGMTLPTRTVLVRSGSYRSDEIEPDFMLFSTFTTLTPTNMENSLAFNEEAGFGSKYGSMGNLETLVAKYGRMKHHEGQQVVVLHKLDGTHTSFEAKVHPDGTLTAGRTEDTAQGLLVSPCKRTGFIGPADQDRPGFSEAFLTPGFPGMIQAIQDNIYALCKAVSADHPGVVIIRIHGETVGGNYPHPDVPVGNGPMINNIGKYCPDHRFVCYDIETVNGDNKAWWPAHDYVQQLCKAMGIYTLTPIAEGIFENVMGATYQMLQEGVSVEYSEGSSETGYMCPVGPNGEMGLSPITRSTLAHTVFGLPELPHHDDKGQLVNPEEGIVIKTAAGGICRNCIKFKHPDRSEVIKTKRPSKPKVQLTETQVAGFTLAQDYITEERLRHVLDKLGDTDRNNAEKIKGMFMKDLITEFCRDHAEYSGKKDLKAIQGELRALTSERVKMWLVVIGV
jgi:Rnl2 family RNA ligase